jgi:PKD repeat protein
MIMTIPQKKHLKNSKTIVITLISLVLIITPSILATTQAYTLTITTNQNQYYPGENVRISGTFTQDGVGVPSASVCVTVTDPDQTDVYSVCMLTTQTGAYSASYTAGSTLGTYKVKAEAEAYGITKTTPFSVVSNIITTDAHGPYFGIVNQEIHYEGSAEGGKTPYQWHWSFGDGEGTDTEDPSYLYQQSGNYTTVLTVKDNGGKQGQDITYSLIADELIIQIDGPTKTALNTPIHFSGTTTGGYPTYQWQWDFNDGNTSTEQNPTHTYTALGEYSITVIVTDQKNFNATDSLHITILATNPPETPTITGLNTGKPGIAYDYTIITTDSDGDDVYYYIDWADATSTGWIGPFPSGQTITETHTWSKKGTYAVKVKAKDILDIESDWATLDVTMPIPKIRGIVFEELLLKFPLLLILYSFLQK